MLQIDEGDLFLLIIGWTPLIPPYILIKIGSPARSRTEFYGMKVHHPFLLDDGAIKNFWDANNICGSYHANYSTNSYCISQSIKGLLLSQKLVPYDRIELSLSAFQTNVLTTLHYYGIKNY